MTPFVLVVPSLKVSGGNKEAVRLLSGLLEHGAVCAILCLWNSAAALAVNAPVHYLTLRPPSLARAALQYPYLLWRFWRAPPSAAPARFIFTHYATFPLALFVHKEQRLFFVQDLEWRFVGNGIAAICLRAAILWFYRSGRLIAANRYLSDALRAHGLEPESEWPVWADPNFGMAAARAGARGIDIAMVLRKGAHKRLDLYLDFMRCIRSAQSLRIAVITTDEEIAAPLQALRGVFCHVRPSLKEMREIYSHSRLFLHLSDHEGFGLPPLEAMGSGCVALCRDSGGVRAFMLNDDTLRALLLPQTMPVEEICAQASGLLSDPARLSALSAVARRVFQRGVDGSQNERDAAERRLIAHVAP